MAANQKIALQIIEGLLRRNKRLQLPEDWSKLTPVQLKLDSLDLVELQLEIETACDIELFGEHVIDSGLNKLPLQDLAAHIEAAMQAQARR